ncbi:uncharacterized protein BYT42DRAFT_617893 [Radiomyces spectabilis]|uniref:uncharacterized protein n=1 Tax=Radiomyces spectabilis TaxID=64574 RepID=UPI00221EA3B1|nr:uncharacterized protein BYT42DRAFT_617893 [Radiomyces spectabilis]KAI8367467.1 hypothetical protein BYT42DRAFT_617893 [Radiomyces spectabilis]
MARKLRALRDWKKIKALFEAGLNPQAMLGALQVEGPSLTSREPSHRTYDETVLYSRQQQNTSDEEKMRTLCLVDALALQPIAFTGGQGIEQNVLIHPAVTEKLVNTSEFIKPILPSNRRFSDINDYGAKLLNSDWEFSLNSDAFRQWLRQERYSSVRRKIKQLSSTPLKYGRTKSVDVSCEPFGKLEGSVQPASVPPPAIHTRYPGVCPTTLMSSEGSKLVVGTKVSNALITSSMCVDKIVSSANSWIDGSSRVVNINLAPPNLQPHIGTESVAFLSVFDRFLWRHTAHTHPSVDDITTDFTSPTNGSSQS